MGRSLAPFSTKVRPKNDCKVRDVWKMKVKAQMAIGNKSSQGGKIEVDLRKNH
jgi:hypothetical protein